MSNTKESPLGWKPKKLIDVADLQTGITKNSKRAEGDIELPYLRVANVQNGVLDLRDIQKISIHKEKVERYRLYRNDLLLVEGNGNPENLGRCAIWDGSISDCVHQNHLFVLRARGGKIDYRYLALQIMSERGRYYLLSCSKSSSGLATLNSTQLKGFPIIVPPLPEQKAIADLLSTWDEAIEKTERLIQAKKKQKLGELHSRISSQKANSTIGAFARPVVRKVDKPGESYVAVGIRSHFKGTFQRLVEDPRTVNMDSLYRVKENDLILNITFAWEGAIALVKKEDEECYVSHRFPTFEIKRSKAEPCFIRQLIMSSRMKYDLSNISPGGAGRNRVLNKKDFLKMPIWLPDLETQKNIGEYLEAIDKEIDLMKQLADKYKTQKRGLMQKMLTGEWRVRGFAE
ncbi:MAG: restriction endonuclease subunit S [Desulfobacteraceae bacterium]|jgi:type I restriction enzyme S subunit